MWNCSAPPSLLLPFGDDYLKCESSGSSQAAGAAGLDRMLLAADYYDLCRPLNQSSQSLQSLDAQPMIFPLHGSGYYSGGSSIYNGEGAASSPASARQLDCTTQPTTAAAHSVKWTAARETVTTGGDGSRLRGSKRLKTTTAAATAHSGMRCNAAARPRNQQPVKAPCKRSQKLGDKITALQQLVSPYGKTDTASVLQEVAICIKHLHQQIQILTASYPDVSSPTSHKMQDSAGGEGGEGGTDLRRRGLCVVPLSPAVVELVASAAARDHGDTVADTGDCWRQLGTL